ncbi:MAG: DNA mismatch repair protein MutS [Planctomycetes bacterium]|nr:DNA mismatch repair protein MutS [Planctomycetota bacterium]
MTPLMEQYQAIKTKYPGEILFFRLGDFYEMFYDDAKTASRVLGITLTSRFKDEKTVPMAGVPYHSATNYINRLLKSGFKVAICEQTEPAESAEGLVDRSVIRVITPGTILEDNILNSKAPNFLCAIAFGTLNAQRSTPENAIGLAWIDLSTGEFKTQEFPYNLNRLIDELRRINPAECLIPEYLADQKPEILSGLKASLNATFTPVSDWTFEFTSAYKTLLEHFHTANLAGFGCEGLKSGISSAGAIMQYLYHTQPSHNLQPGTTKLELISGALKYITKLERYSADNRLYIDRTTQVSLELLGTISSQRYGLQTNAVPEDISYGSLLWVLDKTQSAMGARLLRDWLLSPLTDISRIKQRQDGVGVFVRDMTRRRELQKELKDCVDIERITAKIGSGRANPRDMVALKRTLQRIPLIKSRLVLQDKTYDIIKDIFSRLDPLEPLQKLIATALVDDPPLEITEGGFIREDYNAELDKLRGMCKEGMDFIARFQAEEIKRTGINSLKVGYNQVFGYYIEITNVHQTKIPDNYIRKQTLKNCERYITPELKDYETQVLHARERSQKMEYEIFIQVRQDAEQYITQLQNIASGIAQLDCLLSLATVASENNYCAPTIDDSLVIKITEGRHPVLEKILDEKFIPNDILLDNEQQRIIILTGPNMAGKSTYIRQVALIVLMAQMGGFVPAREAIIGVVDRIFTRVGASDELTRGASTFMVEMNETANILNNATTRSLIILDEIGRGTSTFDGVSIAWAVTEYIHDRLGSRTLFATHYHELTELALILPAIKNYHIAVKEWGDKIIFTRQIIIGGTDKSYGIHVARLAGLPKETIKRSRQILGQLEKQGFDVQGKPLLDGGAHKLKPADLNQLALFSALPHPVAEALKDLDVNSLTPIQALEKLAEIKKLLDKEIKQNEL